MHVYSKARVFTTAAKALSATTGPTERVYKVSSKEGVLYVVERNYHYARSQAFRHWGGKCKLTRLRVLPEDLAAVIRALPANEQARILATLRE